MSVRRRLGTGLRLARDSLDVLRDHPNLLWFPAFAGLAVLVFLVAVLGTTFGLLPFAAAANVSDTVAFAAVAVAILGSTFVATLFTAGLMFAAREALHGKQPSVRGGLRAAWEHKWTLLAWAVVSAVVGVVVRALQESNNVGSVVVGVLFSVSWAVVTYFVVPVAVFEDEPITGVFGRSVDIVRETWGESLGAEFGLGFVHLLLFGAVGLLTVGVAVLTSPLVAVGFVGLPLGVLAFVVASTLNGIAKVALYEYATGGDPPRYFENVDFDVGGDGSEERSTVLGGIRRGI